MCIAEGYITKNSVPGRRNFPSTYWSALVQETLKIIQAIATALDCLPELEEKTLLLKATPQTQDLEQLC